MLKENVFLIAENIGVLVILSGNYLSGLVAKCSNY